MIISSIAGCMVALVWQELKNEDGKQAAWKFLITIILICGATTMARALIISYFGSDPHSNEAIMREIKELRQELKAIKSQ